VSKNSGKPVRDWLLDKYTNAAQNLREQKLQITVLEHALEEAQIELDRAKVDHAEDLAELHSRIHDMAPTKRFIVVYRQSDGSNIGLTPVALSSTNGVTTVTVERAA
jgi:hypothetical protein